MAIDPGRARARRLGRFTSLTGAPEGRTVGTRSPTTVRRRVSAVQALRVSTPELDGGPSERLVWAGGDAGIKTSDLRGGGGGDPNGGLAWRAGRVIAVPETSTRRLEVNAVACPAGWVIDIPALALQVPMRTLANVDAAVSQALSRPGREQSVIVDIVRFCVLDDMPSHRQQGLARMCGTLADGEEGGSPVHVA